MVFFIYICEIFLNFAREIGNLVVVSFASILYIFVGKGNGNKFQAQILTGVNYLQKRELRLVLARRTIYSITEGRGRYFVARREISYEEKGKGRFVTLDYLLIF